MSKVICIIGPTATGKTDLAIFLSQQFPADIISVDSAMIYRHMDIGTAKPTTAELAAAPHKLINLCEPNEHYSAGQFCLDAIREIHATLATNRTPILVGGSMLYFNLLQKGFSEFPDRDTKIRDEIDARAAQIGWEALHAELEKIDPKAAASIHPNDAQRIQRALELFYATGHTRSELHAQQVWQTHPFDFSNIILNTNTRARLHERIELRVDKMLAIGFLAEVKKLFERGDLDESMPSIRSVGYRQAWEYCQGKADLTTTRLKMIAATRQFAKRQCTWLKRFEGQQFDCDAPSLHADVLAYVHPLLQRGS